MSRITEKLAAIQDFVDFKSHKISEIRSLSKNMDEPTKKEFMSNFKMNSVNSPLTF